MSNELFRCLVKQYIKDNYDEKQDLEHITGLWVNKWEKEVPARLSLFVLYHRVIANCRKIRVCCFSLGAPRTKSSNSNGRPPETAQAGVLRKRCLIHHIQRRAHTRTRAHTHTHKHTHRHTVTQRERELVRQRGTHARTPTHAHASTHLRTQVRTHARPHILITTHPEC